MKIHQIFFGVACLLAGLFAAGTDGVQYEQICPGGGGRFMYPAFSSADPNVFFCSSDMGPCYRSENRGYLWHTYPSAELQVSGTGINGRSSWTPDPHHSGTVWVGAAQGVMRSTDNGRRFEPVDGPWQPKPGAVHPGAVQIAFDPHCPDRLAAVFDRFRHKREVRVCISDDGGKSWNASEPLPMPAGTWNRSGVRSVIFDPREDGTLLVFGSEAILRSRDRGKNWEKLGRGLPEKDGKLSLCDATGGGNGKRFTLYATSKLFPKNGDSVTPGVYRSDDGGENWMPVGGSGLPHRVIKGRPPEYEWIQTSNADPQRVYVTLRGRFNFIEGYDSPEHGNVFGSSDGGKSWKPLLFTNTHQKSYNVRNAVWTSDLWGWGGGPTGLAVDPADPDRVLTVINGLYLTENGGRSWRALHAMPVEATGQRGGGMPVMSSWSYNFDPHVKGRHFLSMTDYCGFVSETAGRTWRNTLDAAAIQKQRPGYPWLSNIYNVAFDPRVPGRIYAATSAMHDIPFYTYRERMHEAGGGVVRSDDGGKTWQVAAADRSLPNAAMTDILIVPGSYGRPDTLFVAALGKGIYASTNGGKNWQLRNGGIAPDNLSILKLRHINGRLYALATVNMRERGKPRGGALYVSDDFGRSWRTLFQRADAPYPVNLAVDSRDGQRLAVCVFSMDWQGKGGGLYLSEDGGKNWRKALADSVWALTYSPNRPERLYASILGNGLKISDDGGKSWRREEAFPYWRPTGVFFDPANSDVFYVTSFGGGVYKGYESRIGRAEPETAADNTYPALTLRNGALEAVLYTPDAERGFYRGCRFDHSGMVAQVRTRYHRYFDNFRVPHDPEGDDAGSGPAEEFSPETPPGYADAEVGDTFLKIGVGHLVKINDRFYWSRRKFPVAEAGCWRTRQNGDREIHFLHRLPPMRGYGYEYGKTVTLDSSCPVMTVSHELRNTGEKTIETAVYGHNFIFADNRPVGPEYQVEFIFDPVFSGSGDLRGAAKLEGRRLLLTSRLLRDDFNPLYTQLTGFEKLGAAANDFTVTNRATGASVRLTGDTPLHSLAVYGQDRALCVEPFTTIRLRPGETVRWQTRWEFKI